MIEAGPDLPDQPSPGVDPCESRPDGLYIMDIDDNSRLCSLDAEYFRRSVLVEIDRNPFMTRRFKLDGDVFNRQPGFRV